MPSIINKIKHSKWTMLVPLALVFLATLHGQLVRGLCLFAAVGVSIWIFRDTELAKGKPEHSPGEKNKRTLMASLVFVLLAVLLFFGSNRLDRWASASKIETPKSNSSQVAENQPTSQQTDSSAQQSVPPAQSTATPNKKKPAKNPPKPTPAKSEPDTPPLSAQPTYSVTNPKGSIVNQGSTNYGTQTVNNINADRRFSDETANATAAKLESFRTTPVFISCVPGDAEQQQLARQLVVVLKDGAHWNAQLDAASIVMARTISGIEVQAPSQRRDAATALANSLTALGMTAYVADRETDDSINVLIGAKR